jgi:hypothetical protein
MIAAHDGEIGFGSCNFAEAHIAAVSGVELGLDVRVGEENEIEGAWLGLVVSRKWHWKRRQDCCGAGGGRDLEKISAMQLHAYS